MESTVHGMVERVTFHDPETGNAVLRVRMEGGGGVVTVLGRVPRVAVGEMVEAGGKWVENAEWGRQFRAQEMAMSRPVSEEGMVRYLGSGLIEGVGPVYAEKIVRKFGGEVFEVIEKASKRLEEVEGIGPKRRREIKESWNKQKSIHGIMLFLHEHGISTTRAMRIYKQYGDEAVEVLRGNPYRLVEDLRGVGFRTADAVAGKLGVGRESVERVEAGLLHLFSERGAAGDCAVRAGELTGLGVELLGVDGGLVESGVERLLGKGKLVRSGELVYEVGVLRAEEVVAGWVRENAEKGAEYPEIDVEVALKWFGERAEMVLAEQQAEAVRLVLDKRLQIITGGPGVGKTTVLRAVRMILAAKGVRVVLAAPTGRAARRLEESAGVEAKTLHRLLGYQPEVGFTRGGRRRLEGDLFVVDEVSMVDVELMAAFLGALPEGAHVLLVGDVDQLPSVGAGRVFGDLLESGKVSVVALTEIFRQGEGSRIVEVSHMVREGVMPELEEIQGGDFFFVRKEGVEGIRDALVRVVVSRLPERFGFDPVRDVQVLTPMNRGALGTGELNKVLQGWLNPGREGVEEFSRGEVVFRRGDKVIQSVNDYEREVFNGDIGIVRYVQMDPVEVVVYFEGDRSVRYAMGDLEQLRLAYAVTIHKSQGSEFPVAVIPVSMQHFVMLRRNLFYTGMTRGKRMVVLVGEERAFQEAVKRGDAGVRVTGLTRRICE